MSYTLTSWADMFERIKLIQSNQHGILRLIATGCSLSQTLEKLVYISDKLFPSSNCLIMMHNGQNKSLQIGAASKVDIKIQQLLDNTSIATGRNIFSEAAFSKQTIIVTDIANDRTFDDTRNSALCVGYKSCLASPLLVDGELLGVIGMYFREGRVSLDEEREFIEEAANLLNVAFIHDQSERRMRILSLAVEQTDDLIVITDREGMIEYVNPAFERVTGFFKEELLGTKTIPVKSELHEESFYTKLWDTILSGRPFHGVFINRRKDESLYYEEKTITPLKDENGDISHFVSTGKDISERMDMQQQFHHLTYHDPLTNLGNRALLLDHLDNALTRATRDDGMVALIYVDLDRFKAVNDSRGYKTGDGLLRAVGKRLRECVRGGDAVSRLGGDEFTVLLPSIKHIEEPAHVAQNLLDTLRLPFTINGHEVFCTASIGIALYPNDAISADVLLNNAGHAMYRAKTEGGNTFEFFTVELTKHIRRCLDMENKLHYALDRNEFSLNFQPRIDIQSGQVCGFEALLRWDQSELGAVPPNEFIPVLEETGLIIPVGEWVFETACAYAESLHLAGLDKFRIAVNVSARQFRNRNLVSNIKRYLQNSQLNGHYLEIEITESLLVENVDKTISMLNELHNMGIYISIDDFGTGYSSLAYLKRFPINTIKIDRAFVRDLTTDPNDRSIIVAIIAMARSLGYRVTAEGVETREQLEFLRLHGCDEIQGYFISQPLSAVQLQDWLFEHKSGAHACLITG